ncbi:MAG TPA: hypothetical protein VK207_04895 [Bacteroidales bacterium]|nr:hypothetical protein [Bacteroidales bacterium]
MKRFLTLVIFFTFFLEGNSQNIDLHGVKLMFWNVENVFDTMDDPQTEDNDFLPAGTMRWNDSRYWKKINDIYKTIIAAGEWTTPDVVAFCEIENRKVLQDIIYDTPLSRFEFGIIHEDSPDERGIDVCLIYRQDRLELASYKYFAPDGVSRNQLGSRTILYAKLRAGKDTVHLFCNHWPSRIGGVLAGEELRQKLASTVKRKADSIYLSSKGRAKIIISGDFNCTPAEKEIRILTQNPEGAPIVNLSSRFVSEGTGTYRYKGTWEMIDQVMVSEYLISCNEGLYADMQSMKIFSPFFLLTKDADYPGLTPFSMYRGRRYRGGVSDHLPVLVDLGMWPDSVQE